MSYANRLTRTTFMYDKGVSIKCYWKDNQVRDIILKGQPGIILKGQPGINKTKFKDKEKMGDTWLILIAVTLEPSAKVMKQGILEGERDENKELLPTMWSKAPESIIHGLWLLSDWEMQAVELWPLIADDVWDSLAALS